MHEMSIAENILEIIRNTLKDDHRKLLSVTVEVGELTAVVPDSLQFCFEVISENSPFKGAKLKIKEIPLHGVCKDCGKDFRIKDFRFNCPQCHSLQIRVSGGQELNVSELEVE